MMTEQEYAAIAIKEGIEVAMVKALEEVESSGRSTLSATDLRTPILFEGQWFHKFTHGRYDADHPGISYPSWDKSKYVGGAGEYDRLAEAAELDEEAAYLSVSMGPWQVMGFNHADAGYHSAREMFDDIARPGDEGEIRAFEGFLEKHDGVLPALRNHDFRTVAEIYNGPGQVEYYARKLDAAYSHYKDGGGPRTILQRGSRGPDVAVVQRLLNLAGAHVDTDGDFGPETEKTVRMFQTMHGLPADGIVGPNTITALKNQLSPPPEDAPVSASDDPPPGFVKPLDDDPLAKS